MLDYTPLLPSNFLTHFAFLISPPQEKSMKRYEIIEHTADIGLRIFGHSQKDLFQNAALALFEQIADLSKVDKKKTISIELEAPDKSELFVSWLRELLYQADVRKMVFSYFDIMQIDEFHLRGVASGEEIDLNKHIMKAEVKAVTYHQLKLENKNNFWTAEVIFDA